jgi:hypothetical protein
MSTAMRATEEANEGYDASDGDSDDETTDEDAENEDADVSDSDDDAGSYDDLTGSNAIIIEVLRQRRKSKSKDNNFGCEESQDG